MPRKFKQILVLLFVPFTSSLGQENDSLTTITYMGDTLAIVQHLLPSSSDSVYDFDKCDSLPKLDMNTFKMPKYPVEEEKAGIEGSVMFELIVSPQGIPVKARLVRSSRKAFTKISFESVMNSRFHPALKSGKAVFCRFNFPVGFRLRKKH